MLPRDFLASYSQRFGAAEVDSTFYRIPTAKKVVLVLADLSYMPKLDKVTTEFSYIRLLGRRSAVPDDFSRVRLDRELSLWAGRIRTYLDRRLEVFAFANNCFQGHGPATARALLTGLSRILPTS